MLFVLLQTGLGKVKEPRSIFGIDEWNIDIEAIAE